MQGVNEVVNLTNLGLENYVKECRERLLTAARSVDYDLIEPIRETTIQAKKQKEESKNSWDGKLHVVSWERCCMLFHGKDVAWPVCMTNYGSRGITIDSNGWQMGP